MKLLLLIKKWTKDHISVTSHDFRITLGRSGFMFVQIVQLYRAKSQRPLNYRNHWTNLYWILSFDDSNSSKNLLFIHLKISYFCENLGVNTLHLLESLRRSDFSLDRQWMKLLFLGKGLDLEKLLLWVSAERRLYVGTLEILSQMSLDMNLISRHYVINKPKWGVSRFTLV